ncbi:hypothetical protein LTR86_009707 [Recurvomyces mirabilis]|nr:hypothetical protein LTR86_009707 [Recurvomyces mirabilis]
MASLPQRSSNPPSAPSSPVYRANSVEHGDAALPAGTNASASPSPIDVHASAPSQTLGSPQPSPGGRIPADSSTADLVQGQAPPSSSEPPLLILPVPSSAVSGNTNGVAGVNYPAGSIGSVVSTSQASQDNVPNDQAPKIRRGFFGLTYAWLYELIACSFSVLMVVIEIVLLAVYNNKSSDDWTHTWSINSVFAFLTTLLEASIAFAVASCLGQLRWLWFQKGNQELRWMDKLTNARQPSGALTFVVSKGAWRHWAALGALLIVALLGTSVFTQEVIVSKLGTHTHDPSERMCRVPISNNYLGKWQTGGRPGAELPFTEMITAVYSGFGYPASVNDADTVVNLVNCTSGNCDFQTYSSLAVCYQCADISDTIITPCDVDGVNKCNTNSEVLLTLPDGSLTLDSVFGIVNTTSDTQYPDTSVMSGIGPLIAHWKAMGSTDWPEAPPYAKECAMYWCVNTYYGQVIDNTFYETPANDTGTDGNTVQVPTWTNTSAEAATTYGSNISIYLNPPDCQYEGAHIVPNATYCEFEVDAASQRALQNYLVGTDGVTGFLTGDVAAIGTSGHTNDTFNATGLAYTTYAANVLVFECTSSLTEDNCTQDFYDTFEYSISNLSSYMTNELRKMNDTGPGYSWGWCSDYEQHFHVRWGWLAYPIAMVLISLMFVLVTIYKSRGHEPWKNSVTALMFHGFHDLDYRQIRLDDPDEMVQATRKWSVTLRDVDETKRFVKTTVVPVKEEEMPDVRDALAKGALHGGQAVIQAYGQASGG